ncbi:MAG: 2-oxoacid:acceptor oxidoreductase subunit alpha [Chloroflexota bacterium]|nr:MAG: 2-oxoacid:acceptor oxidoreductase subunit alpha [Chloroflexota bacterium]
MAVERSRRLFINGDMACAEGALAAGCGFFAGYPITPSTEIAEHLSRRLPETGGTYIQMEDELASIAAVLGASWGGARAMTATSGPGFSLMMENIGLAAMTETPCVIVDVQRGGPSTGLPTLVAQADVMQAKWGSHGDWEPVAYAPASCQEMFDLTIQAFNTAERFRTPVFVMSDEIVGHLTEPVEIPASGRVEIVGRRLPTAPAGNGFKAFEPGSDLVPPMPPIGAGYRVHVTGLTHDERGYPATTADVHDRLVRRLCRKITDSAPELIRYEADRLDDAEIVVVAFGSSARVAKRVVNEARDAGHRVGLLRLITLWPFPGEFIADIGERVKAFVFPEMNLGQMAREVDRYTARPVIRVNHAGGALIRPEAIWHGIKEGLESDGRPDFRRRYRR